MSSYSRYDDRRYFPSRRDSSQSFRRDRDRDRGDRDPSRRSIPGPSRGRSPPPPAKPRDENELPKEFGRPTQPTSKEDENTVLRRMKTAFTHSPLLVLYQCVKDNTKIKVWTRNFKEVRGICSGIVVAFDKHWNMILSDVEEVYMKPKKAKTPYLHDTRTGDLPELPPKVPRVKKTPEEAAEEEAAAKKAAEEEAAAKKAGEEEAGAKKAGEEEAGAKKAGEEEAGAKKATEKKKKRKGRKVYKRLHKQLFIRGDNIVLCALFDHQEETSS